MLSKSCSRRDLMPTTPSTAQTPAERCSSAQATETRSLQLAAAAGACKGAVGTAGGRAERIRPLGDDS